MPRSKKPAKGGCEAQESMSMETKEIVIRTMIQAFKNREEDLPLMILVRCAKEIIEYDKLSGNRILYWAIISEAKSVVCPRICNGEDPDCLFPFSTSSTPLCKVFTLHNAPTFTREDGKPIEQLDIPAASVAFLARAWHSYTQVINHGGNPDVRIPQTGQTPAHVLGLCMGREIHYDAEKGIIVGELSEAKISFDDLREASLHVADACSQLMRAGANIRLTDKLGRCPISSAIQAGQLNTAAGMICAFSQNPAYLRQMDYLHYIYEAIISEGKRQNTPFGLKLLLHEFNVCFLEEHVGKPRALASSSACKGSNKNLAVEICSLTRHAIKQDAITCFTWLCKVAQAKEMHRLSKSKEPMAHYALESRSLPMIKAIVDSGINLTEKNEQGLSVLYCACRDNREAFVLHFCQAAPNGQMHEMLLERDQTHGITALGHAVAWGYKSIVNMLLHACRKCAVSINCQLDRHLPSSPYHMPCFSAIAHGYSDIVLLLLNNELDPNHPDVCCEHELQANKEFLRHPTPKTRTSTLLMYASAMGESKLVSALLDAGAVARYAPPGNAEERLNALTMALEYPDTGETWEEPSGTLPHMTTHRQPKSEEHCAEPKQDAGLSLGKNTSKNAVQQRSELSAESKEKEAGSAADRIQLQNLKISTSEGAAESDAPVPTTPSQEATSKPNFRETSGAESSESGGKGEQDGGNSEPDTASEEQQHGKVGRRHKGSSCSVAGDSLREPSGEPSQDGWRMDMLTSEVHLECISKLLSAGASMTKSQVHKLRGILSDSLHMEVGTELVELVMKKIRKCASCQEYGIWKACRCRQIWYCGQDCQKENWPRHKKNCTAKGK